MRSTLRIVLTAAGCAGFCATAAAQPETFYAGKTVKVIIGTSSGGGYDLYGRFLARHIGKHIPGRPTVISVNIPGAASMNAANYLANVAPRDGTEILTIVQTLPLVQATRNDKVRFDLAAFNWIGNMVTAPNVFISWRDSKVASIRTRASTSSWSAPPDQRRSAISILRSSTRRWERNSGSSPGTPTARPPTSPWSAAKFRDAPARRGRC